MPKSSVKHDEPRDLFSPSSKNRNVSMNSNNFQSYMSGASSIRTKAQEYGDFNNSTNAGSKTYAT